MNFKNPFRFKSKPKASIISRMSNVDEWDNPNSVYLASIIVSEYGAVLDQTSIFTLGISEKRLPYNKKEIEAAIELLLKFLTNKKSWRELRQKYPQIAAEILTDRFYNALKTGYMELAKFVPDGEAEPCEKASRLLNEPHNLGKTIDEIVDELNLLWFQEIIQVNKRISEDSSLRLKRLQDNFGGKEILF